MPMTPCFRWTCPISGDEVLSDDQTLPDRWGMAAGEVYSPRGLGILAKRILAHPDAAYTALVATPFPDGVLDDWFASEPHVVPGLDALSQRKRG